MMFATVLTLCVAVAAKENQCDDYYIGVWDYKHEAVADKVYESDLFGLAWNSKESNLALSKYLERFNIQTDVRKVVDYDFTVQTVHDEDVP